MIDSYLKVNFPELPEIMEYIDSENFEEQQRLAKLVRQIEHRLINDYEERIVKKETWVNYIGADGNRLGSCLFEPPQQKSDQLILFIHGGGMVSGSVKESAETARKICAATGMLVFSLDYRLAPTVKGEYIVEDIFSGFRIARREASKWKVNREKICLIGQSAGAGLATKLALKARDQGTPVYKQLLFYPMLDPNTLQEQPLLKGRTLWTVQMNRKSWQLLNGGLCPENGDKLFTSPIETPDLKGLPKTYIDIGELDIFREENMRFVSALQQARVPVTFHLFAGLPHAFEIFELSSKKGILNDIWKERFRFILEE